MHDQVSAIEQAGQDEPEERTNLVLRGDTILGVCEGIGQDFGFNPNWLRAAFAGSFYWNPAVVVGVYVALGMLVALSRLLFPVPASAPAANAAAIAPNREEAELPLAA